jgi:hypothetical protein
MLLIIPATTTSLDAGGAQLLLERRAEEPVRLGLADHALAAGGRHQRVDLNALGVRAHERRVGRVPHMLEVEHGRVGVAEGVERAARRLGRRLRADERVGPAREVVALDVDDEKASHPPIIAAHTGA